MVRGLLVRKFVQLVTESTFQDDIGWLNAVALLNIKVIFVTFDVFHPPIGWLNAVARLNIELIFVTVRGGSATCARFAPPK